MNAVTKIIRHRTRLINAGKTPQPLTLAETQEVITKLLKQQTALELMRKHKKLKGAALQRNLAQSASLRATINWVMGGGECYVIGKLLVTPHSKLAV